MYFKGHNKILSTPHQCGHNHLCCYTIAIKYEVLGRLMVITRNSFCRLTFSTSRAEAIVCSTEAKATLSFYRRGCVFCLT